MSVEGVDFAWGGPVPVGALRSAGKSFVIGYISYDLSKNLRRAWVDTYHRAGIGVVLIWETSARRCMSGYSGGASDAREAARQGAALGLPRGRPIYFGPADYDAPESDQGAINSYMRGCVSVLGKDGAGFYGGYWPGKRLLDAGIITRLWQTYAWSGGHLDPRASIYQYRNEVRIGGVDCDLDRALRPDYGQMFIAGTQPTPAPRPVPPPIPPEDTVAITGYQSFTAGQAHPVAGIAVEKKNGEIVHIEQDAPGGEWWKTKDGKHNWLSLGKP